MNEQILVWWGCCYSGEEQWETDRTLQGKQSLWSTNDQMSFPQSVYNSASRLCINSRKEGDFAQKGQKETMFGISVEFCFQPMIPEYKMVQRFDGFAPRKWVKERTRRYTHKQEKQLEIKWLDWYIVRLMAVFSFHSGKKRCKPKNPRETTVIWKPHPRSQYAVLLPTWDFWKNQEDLFLSHLMSACSSASNLWVREK